MKEFLGIGGYARQPEGYMSWQHLTFATALMVIMIAAAVFLGRADKGKTNRKKNRTLLIAAILMDGIEIFKVAVLCVGAHALGENVWGRLFGNLPLYLCSIQLISIPLAAFSKGRLKQASLDFVVVFGLLGAFFGTYFAGQNYGCYPILSIDNVASGITHAIAGFCTLYILISGMASMKKKNIWITFVILLAFCLAAYNANRLLGTNYMFLVEGDGTPYDIVYRLVNGSQVLYPMLVIGLLIAYIAAFYGVYYLVSGRIKPSGN